jgi:hypothetical protein
MDNRFRFLFLAFLSVLTALIWTFPTWYPVINPDSVTIAYPGLEVEAQADYLLLPEEMQVAYELLSDGDEDRDPPVPPQPAAALALVRARLLGIDLVAPDDVQVQAIPEEATILRRGILTSPDPIRGANGTVIIYQLPTQERFIRFEDEFSVTRAPDVHFVFTRNPDPYDQNGVGIDYIDAGVLLYNVGTQIYPIPQGVDFSEYPILALYVPSINYVLSSATLR